MLAVKTLPLKLVIFRRELSLMGTRFEIGIVGDDPNWAEERIDDAVAEINRVEKLISAFNDDSIVNEINRNAGIKPVKTDAEIFRLIDRSLKISELTHGSFDITYITSDKNTSKLGDKTDNKTSGKKISLGKTNYRNIVLDAKTQTVFLKVEGMRIGFGANGKGYAADRAKYILQMKGVGSGVINAGGDLLTWGSQPDNDSWTIAAADPEQNLQPFANMAISDMAIATSINTGQQTAAINKKYLNAIDPKEGFPVSGIKSVSILSTCAELADAMASPIMSMGINAGLYLINQLNQIACVIVDDHGRVYTSKDISSNN